MLRRNSWTGGKASVSQGKFGLASGIASLVLTIACVGGAGAVAQTATPVPAPTNTIAATRLPEYEVVSVRESATNPKSSGSEPSRDGTRIIRDLKHLVSYAYGVRPEFVSGGPKWCDTTKFVIDAKVAEADVTALENLSFEQRGAMLKPILAERFGLKAHMEVRTLPVYEMVIAAGGSKLKAPLAGPGRNPGGMSSVGTNFSGTAVPISLFVNTLSYAFPSSVGRPILDKTGLTGLYDFEVRWRDDAEIATTHDGETQVHPESIAENPRPSLFIALQEQLGLKLQAAKDPIETIVIDAAHMPTDN